jgi:S-adenosylmethionine decarboxylase
MAYHDALFQLGMDLTRSSTAQKEDYGQTARVARKPVSAASSTEERKDHLAEREGVRFAGHHLIVDLHGASRLDDIEHIERTLERCVEVAGGKLLHTHLHRARPGGGVSGVTVLADGNIFVHSRPKRGFVAFDLMFGAKSQPNRCLEVLREAFGAQDVVVRSCWRGEAANGIEPAVVAKAQGRQQRQRVRVKAAA